MVHDQDEVNKGTTIYRRFRSSACEMRRSCLMRLSCFRIRERTLIIATLSLVCPTDEWVSVISSHAFWRGSFRAVPNIFFLLRRPPLGTNNGRRASSPPRSSRRWMVNGKGIWTVPVYNKRSNVLIHSIGSHGAIRRALQLVPGRDVAPETK